MRACMLQPAHGERSMATFEDVRDAANFFIDQHSSELPCLEKGYSTDKTRKPLLRMNIASNYPAGCACCRQAHLIVM